MSEQGWISCYYKPNSFIRSTCNWGAGSHLELTWHSWFSLWVEMTEMDFKFKYEDEVRYNIVSVVRVSWTSATELSPARPLTSRQRLDCKRDWLQMKRLVWDDMCLNLCWTLLLVHLHSRKWRVKQYGEPWTLQGSHEWKGRSPEAPSFIRKQK